MDYIPKGRTSVSIMFHLSLGGAAVTSFKTSYTRWNVGDGTSFTTSGATALVALATITTAFTANRGIYMTSTADDGGKFLFRADFPDAAFATGADMVICSIYDQADNVIGQRIYMLDVDPAVYAKYMGPYGVGIHIDTTIANTNTRPGKDGTADNPVSTFASANTLATAIGVKKFYLSKTLGTGLSLDVNYDNYVFIGLTDWRLIVINLNSKSVSNSHFINVSVIGTQLLGTRCFIEGGAVGSMAAGVVINCAASRAAIPNHFTLLGGTQDNSFNGCYVLQQNSGSRQVTLSQVGNIYASFNNFSGWLSLVGGKSADFIEVHGNGSLSVGGDTHQDMVFVSSGNIKQFITGTHNFIDIDAAVYKQSIRDSQALTATTGVTANTTSIDDKLGLISTAIAAVSTLVSGVSTIVAAIKAKTDQMIFTIANRLDVQLFGIQAGVDLTNTMKTSVKDQMVAVMNVDPSPELSGITTSDAPMREQIQLIHMKLRNLNETDTTTDVISNEAGAPIATAAIADNGTTFTKQQYS